MQVSSKHRFAELAANVFIRNGIAVYLFSEVVPTPLVVCFLCNGEDFLNNVL